MFKEIKTAYDYFLYHPGKTHVIVQHYILNPVFKCIEDVMFWCIDRTRSILLIAHKIN